MLKSKKKTGSPSSSTSQASISSKFIIKPYMNNRKEFIEFVKELDQAADIAKAFVIVTTGMALIAHVVMRAKGVKVQDYFKLPSVNGYIKRLLVNNRYSRLFGASLSAFETINMFNNSQECNQFLLDAQQKAPAGNIVKNINKFPDKIDIHRGGLMKSISGRITTAPVYNMNEFNVKLGSVTLEEIILASNLDLVDFEKDYTPLQLAQDISGLLLPDERVSISFDDDISVGSEQNLTPLELSIKNLLTQNGIKFPIERNIGTGISSDDTPDPNEPGISSLERRIRAAKKSQI